MNDYLHKQVLTPGQPFAKYEILELLGKGGMGEVYLAHDPFLDRRVAIKVLPLKRTADALFRERMQREAAAGARVEHSHLVRIYDGGVTSDDVVFVVMEYLGEHKTLRQLIFSVAPFAYEIWVRIGIEIADGLMACHAASIVHRDLKPENIVVLPGGHAKIIDFGLAKIRSNAIRTTRGDRRMATPLYASPEQLGGPSKDVTEKADIWALGCVLYEMAVGKQVWQTTTGVLPSPQEATWAMQMREPSKLAESGLDLPRGLIDLVDRCFERDPTKRPTAFDLARGLRQFLLAKPQIASTDPLSSGFQPRSPAAPAVQHRTPAAQPVVAAASPVAIEAATDVVAEPRSFPVSAAAVAVTEEQPQQIDEVRARAVPAQSSDVFDPDGTRFDRRSRGDALLRAPTTERDGAPPVASPRLPNSSLEPRNVGAKPEAHLPTPTDSPAQPAFVATELANPVKPAAALRDVPPRTLQSSAPAPPPGDVSPGGFRPVKRTVMMQTTGPRPTLPSGEPPPFNRSSPPHTVPAALSASSTPAQGAPGSRASMDASGSVAVGVTQRRWLARYPGYAAPLGLTVATGMVLGFAALVALRVRNDIRQRDVAPVSSGVQVAPPLEASASAPVENAPAVETARPTTTASGVPSASKANGAPRASGAPPAWRPAQKGNGLP